MNNTSTVSENLARIQEATDAIREITGTQGEVIENVAQAVSDLNDDNITKDETIADLEQQVEELTPSGSIEITNNGTINVAGYQYADVNIPKTRGYKVSTIEEMNNLTGMSNGDVCVIETTYEAEFPGWHTITKFNGNIQDIINGVYDNTALFCFVSRDIKAYGWDQDFDKKRCFLTCASTSTSKTRDEGTENYSAYKVYNDGGLPNFENVEMMFTTINGKRVMWVMGNWAFSENPPTYFYLGANGNRPSPIQVRKGSTPNFSSSMVLQEIIQADGGGYYLSFNRTDNDSRCFASIASTGTSGSYYQEMLTQSQLSSRSIFDIYWYPLTAPDPTYTVYIYNNGWELLGNIENIEEEVMNNGNN